MFGLSSAQLESSGGQWTAREILQQPQVWSDIARLVAGEAAGLAAFLKPWFAKPDLRIVLTGAGTSAHIGECLAPGITAKPPNMLRLST